MSKPTAQRQAELRERRRALGMVRCHLWIPAQHKKTVEDFAAQLMQQSPGLASEPRQSGLPIASPQRNDANEQH